MTQGSVAAQRHLILVHTGGTIASRGPDRLDLTEYVETGTFLEPDAMLELIPELRNLAQIHHLVPPRKPSHAWTPDDWLDLAQGLVRGVQEHGADGVVILTGTNTLEELAFTLDLVMPAGPPVVVTGSMRPASALSPDGPMNLYRSALVALEEDSVGRGVLVVANESIYSASDVTKAATYSVSAFQAHQLGPVGWIDPDHQVIYGRRQDQPAYRRRGFSRAGARPLPKVDIVASYAGADGALVDAAVEAGARGLVVAATGSGYPTPKQLDALMHAQGVGVVICISTRTGSGPVVMTAFRERSGFIVSGTFSPWQARLLLMIGLSHGEGAEQLRDLMSSA